MNRVAFAIVLLSLPAAQILAQQDNAAVFEAKSRYEKADRELNQAWTALKKVLPADVFEMAKEKQRQWLKFREQQALAASGKPDEAAAKTSAAYFAAAAGLTEARAEWFRRRAAGKDESMSGSWLDGSGGSIDMVERDNRLFFWINVARTHGTNLANTNLGNLSGIAVWNSPIGWFSDKGREPDKRDETNISFISTDGLKLQLTEANARYYQGKGVYFNGTYYKATPLTEEEERRLIKAAETGAIPE